MSTCFLTFCVYWCSYDIMICIKLELLVIAIGCVEEQHVEGQTVWCNRPGKHA